MTEDVFELGETVIVTCQIKDSTTKVLTDPDDVRLTIYLDSVKKVDDEAMTKESTGNYYKDYLTADLGKHKVEIKSTIGSRITIKTTTFGVIA